MSSTSHKIIFFGTEDFSATALLGLIEAGFRITAVVTKPDSRKGRGQKVIPPRVKQIAQEHHIPVWQPTKLSDITEDVRALQPVAGVLVSYGKIIPPSIIGLFTPGIINLHPSLLPKYRGPSPIESAIKNGDSTTGVSIMQLSAAMDAGPIYQAETMPLHGDETQPGLYETLASKGTELLIKILPTILEGSLQPVPQDEGEATYCSLLNKKDAYVNPQSVDATQLERLIRAHLVFPKTKLNILGHDIIVIKAHLTDQKKTPLDVECRDGEFVAIDELTAPSGRLMNGEAFLNGYAVA